jgi:glycosyltransferase involved in cell wall biosynthesis
LDTKPNILIFSLAYPPFIGGAELAVKEITDRLPEISFTMITANLDGRQPQRQQIGNVSVHRIGRGKMSKLLFPVIASRYAVELAARQKFTAVWGIMANQAGLAALFFKKKFPAVPYVLTLQEGDSLRQIWVKTWWLRPLYKSIYRRADRIQAISRYLGERARKLGFVGQLEIIPNGVDLRRFTPADTTQRQAIRAKLGIAPEQRIVISASRLVWKNGLDTLIRSMRDLDANLLLLGTGELEAKLRSLALEVGLNGRITFVGHVAHDQLPDYLRAADVFVRPSRSEGFGSAFLESMAVGTPVVATRIGGIPDFLLDGQNGLFCEVNNPRDLSQKLEQIFSDSELQTRLAQGGIATAKEYDWIGISAKMNSLLKFS